MIYLSCFRTMIPSPLQWRPIPLLELKWARKIPWCPQNWLAELHSLASSPTSPQKWKRRRIMVPLAEIQGLGFFFKFFLDPPPNGFSFPPISHLRDKRYFSLRVHSDCAQFERGDEFHSFDSSVFFLWNSLSATEVLPARLSPYLLLPDWISKEFPHAWRISQLCLSFLWAPSSVELSFSNFLSGVESQFLQLKKSFIIILGFMISFFREGNRCRDQESEDPAGSYPWGSSRWLLWS